MGALGICPVRELFTKLEEAQGGYVTFGDGNTTKILG